MLLIVCGLIVYFRPFSVTWILINNSVGMSESCEKPKDGLKKTLRKLHRFIGLISAALRGGRGILP